MPQDESSKRLSNMTTHIRPGAFSRGVRGGTPRQKGAFSRGARGGTPRQKAERLQPGCCRAGGTPRQKTTFSRGARGDTPRSKEPNAPSVGHFVLRAAAILTLTAPCAAAQGEAVTNGTRDTIEEIVVVGDLGSLPGDAVKTVFGFDKSLLETPRSVSTVSAEMMDRFNMRDIDELIALAPGSFTQSFFGVAGSLDIRGTPGETYFRGVRRLDNPGNYPTPIGASDRVDIVRGPPPPSTDRPRSAAISTSTPNPPESSRRDSSSPTGRERSASISGVGTSAS